jgi:hypothetical protein
MQWINKALTAQEEDEHWLYHTEMIPIQTLQEAGGIKFGGVKLLYEHREWS